MEIYNQHILSAASCIQSDAARIRDLVSVIQRHGSAYKAANKALVIAEVKELASKYGYSLDAWLGNDEPVPEPPKLEE